MDKNPDNRPRRKPSVIVPEEMKPVFDRAEEVVGEFFSTRRFDPSAGTITVGGERFVMVRAASLSINFLDSILKLYSEKDPEEALEVGRSLLFDLSHVIGINDARNFHEKMGLDDPLARLSAGPVLFSHAGWAMVKLLPGCRPTPDENFYLFYEHPYSFEADAWVRAGRESAEPVCIMNCGYSSGWCEESFGLELTSVEVTCKARGDDTCRFIMAPPDRIEGYVREYRKKTRKRTRKASGEYDIPEFLKRKKIEEELRESEELFRMLFEASAEGIVMADSETMRFEFANPAICTFLGYAEAEMLEKTIRDVHTSEGFESILPDLEIMYETGAMQYLDVPCLRKNGQVVFADIYGRMMKLKGREYIVGFFHDLSERKKADLVKEKLAARMTEAQKLESVGRLAAGVAHDFNNILTGMMGYIELMMDDAPEGSDTRGDLESLMNLSKRAAGLVSQLLTFSRQKEFEIAPLEVNDFIRNAENIFASLVGESNVLRVFTSDAECVALADSNQVMQVITNLVINSRDAFERSGEVTISTRQVKIKEEDPDYPGALPGKMIEIVVADDGPGMDEETLANAFVPFYTTRGNTRGSGLGLATVYGIVKKHGGEVYMDSEPGRGTIVRFLLPAFSIEEESQVEEDTDTPTVLLLEDDGNVLKIMTRIMKKDGYRYYTASSAEEAGKIFESEGDSIGLLVSDVILPGMSGPAFYETILEKRPDLPAIFVTGYAESREVEKILEFNNVKLIKKPFPLTQLQEAIKLTLADNG